MFSFLTLFGFVGIFAAFLGVLTGFARHRWPIFKVYWIPMVSCISAVLGTYAGVCARVILPEGYDTNPNFSLLYLIPPFLGVFVWVITWFITEWWLDDNGGGKWRKRMKRLGAKWKAKLASLAPPRPLPAPVGVPA